MGMYYNVIDANIIAIPQGFLKPKKYLVEVTFEKNSFEFPYNKNPNSTKKLYFDIKLKDNRNIKDMVPELTKLSIEGNIAHNKGLIFTQLMQYAVWEKQQQFGSALGLF